MDDTQLMEFRCVDIGLKCAFKTNSKDEEEMMDKVGKHAAEVHDIREPDEKFVRKIKGAIRMM
jgi:predicted small metal-binding protein